MRRVVSWAARVGTGIVRAGEVTAASFIVPAIWALGVMAWLWFGRTYAEFLVPLGFASVSTVVLVGPVARRFRSFPARWAGIDVPVVYRWRGPVVQLSTGQWWNGFSYQRSREEALADQRERSRWSLAEFWRDVRFVAIAPFTAGAVAAVPVAGIIVAAFAIAQPPSLSRLGTALALQPSPLWHPVGAVAFAIAVVTAPYAWKAAIPLAVRFLSSPQTDLAQRVEELTAQRTEATAAQAAEIRRIERDLHDGAQARLVSLGLALATAEKMMETDPAKAKALMREARTGAAASLEELRELVRGICPPVLTERGLVEAVRALALDSPLETLVEAEGGERLDAPIEAAVYFGVCELIANAAKHARADRAVVGIAVDDGNVVVRVLDDGRGGVVERAGGGLDGLRRRLSVFDGTLEVHSPVGGPTLATMVVPCASS
ncbi:sensor histidine kinase [Glycomyces lechevalierae]|uniref:histidine kinase n=1 Tax=Glycomyces lechevalierae TaxID=256034 RepID=A0A9X3PXM2_9ACTN|nr:histidine kinase [Glycomyces lechevalierae]MDA1387908.1 histidine kinase [Glycomyces lechevalierae]MDR7336576.1 signal transduction histidine kinase [Glycomyces lechevalierae]